MIITSVTLEILSVVYIVGLVVNWSLITHSGMVLLSVETMPTAVLQALDLGSTPCYHLPPLVTLK